MKKTDMTLPDNHRIDEEKCKSLLQYIRLNVTEKYDFPQEIVQVDGVTVATLGNFSASTGKPKSKKTFNVSAIVASALSGERGAEIQGGACRPARTACCTLTRNRANATATRYCTGYSSLAGLPTDRENDRIEFFVLREYTPDQRRDIIRWALHEEQNIGLVIIDGIRDLIHDINSPSESLDIINELMRWSSYYELHIHTVLHLNKGDDNTRGHIGSEPEQQGGNHPANIEKRRERQDQRGAGHAHPRPGVYPVRLRDRGRFASPSGKGPPVQDEQTRPAVLVHGYDRAAAPHSFEVAFPDNYVPGYQMLLDALKRGYDSIGYSRGRNTLVGLCKFLIQNEAIVKDGRGYAYNENFRIKNRSV